MTEEIKFMLEATIQSQATKICDYEQQLKRLGQERDELKQEYKQAHEDFICSDTALRIANTELDELKQENERLKECINTAIIEQEKLLSQLNATREENKELKETVKSRENELANMTEQANMRINTYRSALEEISDKLDRALDTEKTDAEESFDLLYKIQDTIDEVLNDD